jgi:hypothetical protein
MRDASDVVTQTKLRLMYTTNVPSGSGYNGVNAYRSKGMQNSYNFLVQVQEGFRECGVNVSGAYAGVAGQPFALARGTTVNASGTTVTVPNTIPTVP